jgi:hypothetical protein
VKIKVEAWPTTDTWVRYHGLGIDQAVNEDFWVSQPHKVIAVQGGYFTYETTVDLAPGDHTAEYANSGYVPDYAWHARIYVDGKLVAEGDVGKQKQSHLVAKFTVGAPPPSPGIGARWPAVAKVIAPLAVPRPRHRLDEAQVMRVKGPPSRIAPLIFLRSEL